MKHLFTILSLGLALMIIGCSNDKTKKDSEEETDTNETDTNDTDIGFDTEIDLNRDYWVDGYCPAIKDGDGDYRGQTVSDDCKTLDDIGCCDNSGNVIWCENGELKCLPCGYTDQKSCSWLAGDKADYYTCTPTDNGADPNGRPQSCQ